MDYKEARAAESKDRSALDVLKMEAAQAQEAVSMALTQQRKRRPAVAGVPSPVKLTQKE